MGSGAGTARSSARRNWSSASSSAALATRASQSWPASGASYCWRRQSRAVSAPTRTDAGSAGVRQAARVCKASSARSWRASVLPRPVSVSHSTTARASNRGRPSSWAIGAGKSGCRRLQLVGTGRFTCAREAISAYVIRQAGSSGTMSDVASRALVMSPAPFLLQSFFSSPACEPVGCLGLRFSGSQNFTARAWVTSQLA